MPLQRSLSFPNPDLPIFAHWTVEDRVFQGSPHGYPPELGKSTRCCMLLYR